MAGGGGACLGPAPRPSLLFPCPRAVVSPACLPSAPSPVSSSAVPLPLSLCLFDLFLFFFWGGVRVDGVRRLWCWALVWVGVGAGVGVGVGAMGVGWLLRSGLPVCVSALRHLVAFGLRGAGSEGAGGR